MLEQIVIESGTELIVNLVKQINETNSHLDVVPVTITYDMIRGNITYDDLVKDKEANDDHDAIENTVVIIDDEPRGITSLYSLSVGCINIVGIKMLLTKVVDESLIDIYLDNKNEEYDIINIKLKSEKDK